MASLIYTFVCGPTVHSRVCETTSNATSGCVGMARDVSDHRRVDQCLPPSVRVVDFSETTSPHIREAVQ